MYVSGALLYATVGYLLFVAIALLYRPSNWKTAPAPASKKTKDGGLLALLIADPLRIAQIIYNVTQVSMRVIGT